MGFYSKKVETPDGLSVVSIKTEASVWGDYTRIDVSSTGEEFDAFHFYAKEKPDARAMILPVIAALDEHPDVRTALKELLERVAP